MEEMIQKKPDFLIIGAQKSGTSWLWRMIGQHPETDLPQKKEIHLFGGSEMYRKGLPWYYKHFKGLDPTKVTGEASTTYLFDNVPYWYNSSNDLKFDKSLSSIPELITQELPNVKIIAVLRNPISRAISAYHHLMRRVAVQKKDYDHDISPLLRLAEVAVKFPKNRILEYGFYSKYLQKWFSVISKDRIKVFIYEEDLRGNPKKIVAETYSFLGIDSNFLPELGAKVNKSWGWTRILATYYMPGWLKNYNNQCIGRFFDRHDFFEGASVKSDDINFLKNAYSQEKANLESLLNRKISWEI